MESNDAAQFSGQLSFDHLYNQVIVPFFRSLDDGRAFNASYALLDALKAAFAIYSLKVPSLFQFRTMSQAEDHNLSTVYKIGRLPSDNGLRKVLDGLDPAALRVGFAHLAEHVKATGLLERYHVYEDYVALSVDGVEHFCSKKVSCPRCLQRRHRDGSVSNYHAMLSAAVVKPGLAEVLPWDHEPMTQQDGEVKNDCERTAVHRLLANFEATHPELATIFVLDALYACAPVVERIEANARWRYLIGVKDKGHAHLFTQFDELDSQYQIPWQEGKTKGREEYAVGYANGLELNAANAEVAVNMLYALIKDAKGQETTFTFITNLELSPDNVAELLAVGRARWKIENETFNTLKNQGYHFEHNYGHGQEHLCTVMAYVMLLAFWVDQLQQAANRKFGALLTKLKTRVKLWDATRSVFRVMPVQSMDALHDQLIDLYCVRLI